MRTKSSPHCVLRENSYNYRTSSRRGGQSGNSRSWSGRGRELSRDRMLLTAELGAELGAGHLDLLLPGGNPAGDLYDEYHRVLEHDAAQGVEEPSAVPERRGGFQAALPRVEQDQQEVDNAAQELERGDEPVRGPLRGTSADGRAQVKIIYTDRLELPPKALNLRLLYS